MVKMKKMLTMLLAATMSLSLVACGSSSSSGGTDTASGNQSGIESGSAVESFTVGTGNVLGTFMPASSNETSYPGSYLVYDTLFSWDKDGNIYSDILKDWHYEEDGTTFVMECRDDVYFANGDQMTGEDVLYSVKNLVDRQTVVASNYSTIDWDNSYVSDDGFTVYLANTSEFGPGIMNMGVLFLLDKSWCDENGFDDLEAWTQSPNGSGPYEVVEYVTDSHITLQKRDDYWGDYTDGPETFTINYYADTSAMYMALEQGEIDMALNIAESDYERAVEDDSIGVKETYEGDVILMSMDTENNEYLADENVRLAIAYGVNWEEVAESARGELGEVATSVVTQKSSYYSNVGTYEYNPDLAKEYMEKSGYVADGSTVNFTLNMITVDQEVKKNSATVIQYYLQQLGIDLQTEFKDFSAAIEVWNTPGGTDLNFQDTDTGSIVGEPYFALAKFASEADPTSTIGIKDKTFNELFMDGTMTTDEEQRAAKYEELQQYCHDSAWIIPMYESVDAIAYNPDVVAECNLYSSVNANPRLIVYK